MEILLAVLSLKSIINRKVVAHVFRGLSSLFTRAAIESLIDVRMPSRIPS
jgi:hypothetical protein